MVFCVAVVMCGLFPVLPPPLPAPWPALTLSSPFLPLIPFPSSPPARRVYFDYWVRKVSETDDALDNLQGTAREKYLDNLLDDGRGQCGPTCQHGKAAGGLEGVQEAAEEDAAGGAGKDGQAVDATVAQRPAAACGGGCKAAGAGERSRKHLGLALITRKGLCQKQRPAVKAQTGIVVEDSCHARSNFMSALS